jgi:hypothetical protein
VTIKERFNVLRAYETDCYSICYFLLQCERQAMEAAKSALLQLVHCDTFFEADPVNAVQMLRSESIACSFAVKVKYDGSPSLGS